MKILHHLGHRHNWNLDSYFENKIGDGFIFSAFNFDSETFSKETITGNSYKMQEDVIPLSSIDLQYYGKTSSKDLGKFSTYDFHPANYLGQDKTDVYGPEKIKAGIKFQEDIGFEKIIIPNFYPESGSNDLLSAIRDTSRKLKKKNQNEYYMTLPLSFQILKDESLIDKILAEATDRNITFDGYYIVAEPEFAYKQKLCIDYDYMENLYKALRVLKKNGFKIIYGYANWDSILFTSLVDVDYVTIGTYENLRNFKIKRFKEDPSGGGSKGAYFSSKVLNFIKAEELVKFKRKTALDLIKNDSNIFSDIILNESFLWTSMHLPEVQKNYLLEISSLLNRLQKLPDKESRKKFLIKKIEDAIKIYRNIYEKGVYLETESADYHLEAWLTFLQDK
jgi:hypothetical protein